ncbi:MAG: hypothetical protein ACREKF_02020 [Candidatus Methylomirabilales bacterium]
MRMRRRATLVAWGSAAGAWLVPVAAQACAVCWSGAGSPEHDALARGFYWGVLFLMAMPFAVVASIGGWLWYAHWRGRGRRGKETSVQDLAWTPQRSGE